MRVVMTTYDSRGGVEPLAALAVRLRATGAEVLICAPPDCAERLAVQAHLDGDNAFTYGRLHGRQQALAASLRTGYHDAWSRVNAKKRRKWLS